MLRNAVSIGLSNSRQASKRWAALSSPTFNELSQQCSQNSIGVVRHRSNRSKRGLYDGKDIRSGNNVSFSMKSTKRKFKPNVFTKKVYSEILGEMIKFHLTTSTLRSIDNAGGLDNYLLTSKNVTSGEGLEVKKRIISRLKLNEKIKNWNSQENGAFEAGE